jgi:aldehyde:ferredoxin oxidoreductase
MNPGAGNILNALNAATGWDYSLDELLDAGKRIFSLKRIINRNLGSSKSDDRLPEIMLKPLSDGGTLGFVPDLDPLLKGAYREHGWDGETGMPTDETIKRLRLDFIGSD